MQNFHGNVSVFMKLSSKKYSEANKGISTTAEVVPWEKAYLRRSHLNVVAMQDAWCKIRKSKESHLATVEHYMC